MGGISAGRWQKSASLRSTYSILHARWSLRPKQVQVWRHWDESQNKQTLLETKASTSSETLIRYQKNKT